MFMINASVHCSFYQFQNHIKAFPNKRKYILVHKLPIWSKQLALKWSYFEHNVILIIAFGRFVLWVFPIIDLRQLFGNPKLYFMLRCYAIKAKLKTQMKKTLTLNL